MRASAKPSSADRGPAGTSTVGDPAVVVVARRRLPRPVVWLLWLLGALLGSIAIGFLAGLARPREPDPWTAPPVPPRPPAERAPAADPGHGQPGTTSSDPGPPAAKDD
jgi:hypothetical protein